MDNKMINEVRSSNKFRLVSAVGNLIILVWITIAGGIMLVLTDSTQGWLGIVTGAVLIALPFTPIFQQYLEKPMPEPIFQILTLVGNLLMITLFAWLTSVFLRDPFVMYNRSNKLSLVVWSVATLLSIAAFVANIVVYSLDRKANKRQLN